VGIWWRVRDSLHHATDGLDSVDYFGSYLLVEALCEQQEDPNLASRWTGAGKPGILRKYGFPACSWGAVWYVIVSRSRAKVPGIVWSSLDFGVYFGLILRIDIYPEKVHRFRLILKYCLILPV